MTVESFEHYEKEGFFIVRNLIPIQRIDTLLESVFELYCKYSGKSEDFKDIEKPWNTELFHQKLIELRKNNSESFGAIYDSLKTCLSLNQLVSDDTITDYVSQFLRKKQSEISMSDPVVRLDPPRDTRNIHGWHQDRSYFPQNRDGHNGLVCWAPLNKATIENGAIHVCPESHKEGLLQLKAEEKKDESYTTRFVIPEDIVKKYKDIIVELNPGDAVFFDMLLFHRSGDNISNEIRMSIQCRFHTATAEDYIPFDLINYYSPFIKQKLLENNYDCSDIPDNIRQPPVVLN
ncbi:1-deoxypentalenic acid 11-beta-hydroxylase protein [Marine Group I thaumarchaeote SCGC AAA799-P11]|uniref:1-deoxypentalenic acid 11-beta-hydroxylase protein n=1 Tax=Marine Group I thaumarchaeote SCGC AAA799-P11 TaxID=1502295 RepID=A0A087S300_9ARCH|nr:1-deoxypentalenic acid 11-beta-hydroxylase protein [Marine Group I thaumarchaeote SCGC AAA799-P11]